MAQWCCNRYECFCKIIICQRHKEVSDGTRTRNLPLRRRMPYPLGHGDAFTSICIIVYQLSTILLHASIVYLYSPAHAHHVQTHDVICYPPPSCMDVWKQSLTLPSFRRQYIEADDISASRLSVLTVCQSVISGRLMC